MEFHFSDLQLGSLDSLLLTSFHTSLTENGRVAYPVEFVPGAVTKGRANAWQVSAAYWF